MTIAYIPIPAELNVGCTSCGLPAVIAVSSDDGTTAEIVATACAIHLPEEAV